MKTRTRTWSSALAVAASGMLLVAGVGVGEAQAAGTSWGSAKVVRWIDGDTVVTSKGTVRLIGIDTPERGKCGSKSATAKARAIAPVGSTVRIGNPVSVDDTDRYGRKLRYVDTGTRDIGGAQIHAGAKARYDSPDGYDRHPRQTKYRGAGPEVRRTTSARPLVGGRHRAVADRGWSSWGSWAGQVNQPGPDIDCGDIPDSAKPVRITGPDYHGLDRDGDGWGCDS